MGFEIIATVLLKQDLPYQNCQEEIGKLISYSMLRDEQLKDLHEQPVYKYYAFDSLFPIEKDGIYKKNKIYVFHMRMIQDDFSKKIKHCLSKLENDQFRVIATELRTFSPRFINYLYTVTPSIVTRDGGPFKPDGDLAFLKNRLEVNAEKKYKTLYGRDLESRDFIERIVVLSKSPTVTRYKGMRYLGLKLQVYVRSDENAQKLAALVAVAGLGEKSSSLGAGFCLIH